MKPTTLFRFAAILGILAVNPIYADEKDPVAAAFLREFASNAKQSDQTGIPVAVTAAPRKGESIDVLADFRIRERLKWCYAIPVQPTNVVAKALSVETPFAFAVLDSKGKVLLQVGAKDPPADALKKMNEIGAKYRKDFQAKLAVAETSTAEFKHSIDGLIRMGGSAAEIVPLLRHKSLDVKAAVAKALPTLPPDDVALAAFDGLASDDVEMRAACFRWASSITKVPKTPPLKFWREEDEAVRTKALAEWRASATVDMGPLNKEILEFCEVNLGKKVGDGECSHLAVSALKEANGKPIVFVGKTYVWGREVTAGQKVLPGDIVQLEDCKFKNSTASHHTQVIRKVLGPNRYEVLEQNANGRKTVGPGELDLNKLMEGTVKIFRPVSK